MRTGHRQDLHQTGASFDVASLPEFSSSMKTSSIAPKEQQDFTGTIIYANPTKPKKRCVRWMNKALVTTTIRDELKKIRHTRLTQCICGCA